MTSTGSFLLLVLLIYTQNYNEIVCVRRLWSCVSVAKALESYHRTPVQSKELQLYYFI